MVAQRTDTWVTENSKYGVHKERFGELREISNHFKYGKYHLRWKTPKKF